MITWPPTFSVKQHPRAKHVKLKVSIRNGLELVTPLRFNIKKIPDILEKNKDWILKQLAQIDEKLAVATGMELPSSIFLNALNQEWKIDYIPSNRKKIKLLPRPQQQELVLFGDVSDMVTCKKLLLVWVKLQSERYLCKRLEELSLQTQLRYTDVSIRAQRSRWGSCSVDKSLSLNYKLIFLPKVLVDHILIHELCHTIHMDHSAKFWRLVSHYDKDWKQHSREVRRADKFIPAWIEIA